METSKELLSELTAFNKKVISVLETRLEQLCRVYTNEHGDEAVIEGNVDLKHAIIHVEGNEFSTNEIIVSVHTKNKTVQIEFDGDSWTENLSELNNSELIQIISEVEYFITRPDIVQIG
jgi:ABC-type Fe2+-enterobactin transport system substrate-binding protein